MFIPVKITSAAIDSLIADGTVNENYATLYESLARNVRTTLTDELIKQSLIDGSRLQEEWFPQDIGDFDVFISYSHQDIKKVKQFSYWLNTHLGLRCFIDSVFWQYSDKLLKKLDEHYCRYYDSHARKFYYYYNRRNFTTANIH